MNLNERIEQLEQKLEKLEGRLADLDNRLLELEGDSTRLQEFVGLHQAAVDVKAELPADGVLARSVQRCHTVLDDDVGAWFLVKRTGTPGVTGGVTYLGPAGNYTKDKLHARKFPNRHAAGTCMRIRMKKRPSLKLSVETL